LTTDQKVSGLNPDGVTTDIEGYRVTKEGDKKGTLFEQKPPVKWGFFYVITYLVTLIFIK
jgi:hypothetical protein